MRVISGKFLMVVFCSLSVVWSLRQGFLLLWLLSWKFWSLCTEMDLSLELLEFFEGTVYVLQAELNIALLHEGLSGHEGGLLRRNWSGSSLLPEDVHLRFALVPFVQIDLFAACRSISLTSAKAAGDNLAADNLNTRVHLSISVCFRLESQLSTLFHWFLPV